VAVVVAPKGTVPIMTLPQQADQAVREGAVVLSHDANASVQLIAIGAYQLVSVQRAARVLRDHGVACSVVAMVEPGRFRAPRDKMEAAYVHTPERIPQLIPAVATRLFVCHGHAEVYTGVLRPLDTGPSPTAHREAETAKAHRG